MTIELPSALQGVIQDISALDQQWFEKAYAHHARLTKPAGSLGRLENLGARLCAIQQAVPPVINKTRVMVFAGDHGVTLKHTVGPYPRSVTAQMVMNFVHGGAAINAFADAGDVDFSVVDMGVDANLSEFGLTPSATYLSTPVARGTADISAGPAMSDAQCIEALATGVRLADECASAGYKAVAVGEMGIGNTTIASALTAALTGEPVANITGRGTGADDETVKNKIALIERALTINKPDANNGYEVLRTLGGFELAGIAGLTLGLAKHRIVIVSDGFISTAAVLCASRIHAEVLDYIVCGHRSPEPGHAVLMNAMNQEPLLDLGLRLGEGTGACLSLSLLKAAALAMSGMATFDGAGVDDKTSTGGQT